MSLGYDATSVAGVARAASVTPNTVYWYFSSKDHLFTAMLERWVRRSVVLVERRSGSGDPVEVAYVVKSVVRELQPLLVYFHQRAGQVDVVRRLHEDFHAGLRRPLATALGRTYPHPGEADLAADVSIACLEGAYGHDWAGPWSEPVIEAALHSFAQGHVDLAEPAVAS